MDLKSLQTLRSKTAIKKKNLIHRISTSKKRISNYNLNFIQSKKPKLLLMQVQKSGFIYDFQLIAFFKFIQKFKNLKKRLYVRSYPFLPLTKKPLEVRMGKGKGKIDKFCKPIFSGTILMEIRFNNKKIKKSSSFYNYCKETLLKAKRRFSNLKIKIINQDF